MTSMSNLTRAGAGRRPINQSTSAIPSPSSQRSIEDMMVRERSNSFKDLQAMILQMQETMTKNHEDIKREIGEVRNDTGELKERMQIMDGKLEMFQQQMIKNEQRLQAVEEKMDLEHKRVDEINERLTQANRELETMVILLESEKANYYLRFQNLKEEKGEDLPEILSEILAKALGTGKEEILSEIDEIYRIHTSYARRHNLPKEVHIKFVKKSIRDEILHRARDDPIEYRGRQLVVLKQVPKRVRDLRKPYQFLTTKLIRHNVNFRWLIPEGILVSWQDRRIRIDTMDKAEDFYYRNFGSEEETEEREAREEGEISEIRPAGRKRDEGQNKEREGETIEIMEKANNNEGRLEEPKEIRTTRAVNPKYN